MTPIQQFNTLPFIQALKGFFDDLHIPIDYIADEPTSAQEVLEEFYNPSTHQLIDEVYALGMVNNAIFNQVSTFDNLEQIKAIKEDYEGLLIFGITLNNRKDGLLPTRSQLTDITRAFNRAFPHTPVTIIFKYDTYISFANSERVKYLQAWRDGEKIGKVTLLRDIDFTNVHSGHNRILKDLAISKTGKTAVNSFEELYKYWQSVLNVSILNKAFYGELQNWYFWAVKEVNFPNPPIQLDFASDKEFDEALKEHKGKNVIRLLTRILFIWFIKEKGLIPEEIFHEKIISNDILKEFEPQKPQGLFATGKQSSKYYRAILQNLFFATLNQSCGKREFRGEGKHQNITQLMRYKNYFKNPDYFIELMEKTVPFMNGGLFECLDKPHPTAKGKQGGDRIIHVDGFSDRADNELVVPDFLFFDTDEDVDLSNDLGNAKFKNSKTRGLIAILKSYKFTITENTPIDEDVALDPELLGKVFENLLASYNPETKTTARKQTGSFYTPREIVDYMVDESLIAYLKNSLMEEAKGVVDFGKKQISMFGNEVKKGQLGLEGKVENNPFVGNEKQLDEYLHQLVSYNSFNPFAEDEITQKKIIKALDNCKILDPACGSGAYPMGILQKMVHILHKIDPNNTEWKNRQLKRVNNAIAELEQLDDTTFRENTIRDLEAQKDDIEESFGNNELDYGRKLYLIENCIFGVDIQAIATQISKLRFFISLVVNQKVDAQKENFGIRPLPNLETKFVAANTLIGIDKPKAGQNFSLMFDKADVQILEKKLNKVRQRLFSAKIPSNKRALREEDKVIREQMSGLLEEKYGSRTALQLANWDPYDQNTSSDFFDKEWMFDISEGFDIVIGNPPYFNVQTLGAKSIFIEQIKKKYTEIWMDKSDILFYFIKQGIDLAKTNGNISYIISNAFLFSDKAQRLRNYIIHNAPIQKIINFEQYMVFESALITTAIVQFGKSKTNKIAKALNLREDNKERFELEIQNNDNFTEVTLKANNVFALVNSETEALNVKIDKGKTPLGRLVLVGKGMETAANEVFSGDGISGRNFSDEFMKKRLNGKAIKRYMIDTNFTDDMLYIDHVQSFNVLPKNIQRYLSENTEILNNRATVKNEGRVWWRYSRPMHKEYYNLNKIWTSYRSASNCFAFDETKNYIGLTNTTVIFDTNSSNISLKYYLALVNSQLLNYRYKSIGKQTGGGIFEYFENGISKLPIPEILPEAQQPFIDLVDKILAGKKSGDDTSGLEAEIDMLVYGLYGLTETEIKVVEGR